MALGPGSIAFTGYNADGTDNLAFVVLEDIAAGTVINFTDNYWERTAFSTGENHWSWTAASDITAGTVVTMDDLATASPTSNLGAIDYSTDVVRDFANTFEAVYAYVGDTVSPTFLAAITNTSSFNGGTWGNLVNTGLTEGLTAVAVEGHTIAYNGRHVDGTSFADLLPLIK